MGLIPKRIISIWLGSGIPPVVMDCLLTHTQENYERLFISNDNYLKGIPYVEECIAAKQYVKASDYLRIYYLFQVGGIYLDADIKIMKSFDDLLDKGMFVGREENGFIANSVIGTPPGNPILKEYLGIVDRNFKGGGELVFEPGMEAWSNIIKKHGEVTVFPPEYFFPYNHEKNTTNITNNTHTYHYFLKTWKL